MGPVCPAEGLALPAEAQLKVVLTITFTITTIVITTTVVAAVNISGGPWQLPLLTTLPSRGLSRVGVYLLGLPDGLSLELSIMIRIFSAAIATGRAWPAVYVRIRVFIFIH